MYKPGFGKQKGSAFEREICKKLSLWVSSNERDDLYWRSAMSGGRASVQFKKGKTNKTQVGDITAIDSEGEILTNNWIIECKTYQNLHIDSLFFGTPKSNSLLEYWDVLCKQCDIYKKAPILIAKQNGKPIIILLDFEIVLHLHNFPTIQFKNMINNPIYIYFFDEIVEDIKFKAFLKCYGI
jgi:hypothetical protein